MALTSIGVSLAFYLLDLAKFIKGVSYGRKEAKKRHTICLVRLFGFRNCGNFVFFECGVNDINR